MFDFVPIDIYTPIFYFFILGVVLFSFLHTQVVPLDSSFNLKYMQRAGIFTLIIILLYMGLRPINGVFIDMTTYNNIFLRYSTGGEILNKKDIFFQVFTKSLSYIVNAEIYFFICASLYVLPLYFVCRKWFQDYWFYGFLFLVGAFSFWAYGTNGIRNGIASSLFLLAVSREKRLWQFFWIFIAINFHKTMLLPTLGFLLANFYNKPKKMIVFWALCIPISLIGGEYFGTFFSTLGIEDERISYLTAEVDSGKFSTIGFRWDFLIYSATAVFAGWFYIVKKNFNDRIYFWLFNTYVFSNAFWILVIRANFSNRFAYLSWFMMAIIIVYPLLKIKLFTQQHKVIGLFLVIYFGFTFLLNVVLI